MSKGFSAHLGSHDLIARLRPGDSVSQRSEVWLLQRIDAMIPEHCGALSIFPRTVA
ncbi:hypothetical protein ACE103_07100 [Bradyrhizobium sp. ma5]|uniref:hypothetical protein n=1 Tax=unclassified Bradyrhizobium TaxID=2631580 RepID=UPI001CC46EED|nr:hypothetical protein [Bradyrhizobium sp. RD5-C2]